MPALITIGRVLFAVLFIYLGATKLLAIQGTAGDIGAKIAIPTAVAPYTKQVETLTGMTTPQLLAVASGVFEIIAGLSIAFNLGARFFAVLLIIYVAISTFYFHDFWNQKPPESAKTLVDALKNLSIIGALFMIVGYGRGPKGAGPTYGDV